MFYVTKSKHVQSLFVCVCGEGGDGSGEVGVTLLFEVNGNYPVGGVGDDRGIKWKNISVCKIKKK